MAKYIIKKSANRVSLIQNGIKYYSLYDSEIISEPINGLQNAKNILSNLWLDFYQKRLVTFESQPLPSTKKNNKNYDSFFIVHHEYGYDLYSVNKLSLYI